MGKAAASLQRVRRRGLGTEVPGVLTFYCQSLFLVSTQGLLLLADTEVSELHCLRNTSAFQSLLPAEGGLGWLIALV